MKGEELLKIAKPILFNTKMVQAILDNRKTVTRRLIKPQPPSGYNYTEELSNLFYAKFEDEHGNLNIVEKPYMKPNSIGEIGDYLYVRETFCEAPYEYEHIPTKDGHITVPKIAYKADSEVDYTGIWKPSIHMPKEFARIFLKVTDVGVERLQDIAVGQCLKEGCNTKEISSYMKQLPFTNEENFSIAHKLSFKQLWNSTIKKQDLDKYGWDANPWVFVIEFEVLKS